MTELSPTFSEPRGRSLTSSLLPPRMPATMTGISMVKSSSLLAKARTSMLGKMAEQGKSSRLQGSRTLRGAGARNLVHSPVEEGHNDAASVLEFSLELVDFAAGSCGGCMGVLVGHPFDTVKVRMQNFKQAKEGAQTSFSGRNVVSMILKEEGFRGFWKGIEAPLIGNIPVQAIVFGTYGSFLRRIGAMYGGENEKGEAPIWQIAAAGCLAGFAQTPAVAAAEFCKTQMQMQFCRSKDAPQSHTGGQPSAGGQVLYKNSLQCFTHTVRHFGPAAVFRGTLITAIRDVNYGQWFAQYEWTKRWLMSQHEEGESKMFPIYSALAGALAGATGWIVIFPIDTMKTRIQTRQAGTPAYRMMDCARDMWREQANGRAFTRGLGVCLVRSIPVNAVTFLTYEIVMELGAELHATHVQ